MKKIILIMIAFLSCQIIFASELNQCKLDEKNKTSSGVNDYSYLLFPFNIAPNIITNTTWYCYTGTRLLFANSDEPAWGVIVILSTPFYGLYYGISDSINGHPFWEIPKLRHKQHISQEDSEN